MTSYSIETGDGGLITAGQSGRTAQRTAQRLADERGESVFLFAVGEGGDYDDGEEIAPSSISVVLDTANGPRVEWGGHDVETVEAEIPVGYTVDWSSAIEISVGTAPCRYRAPLVVATVTSITMRRGSFGFDGQSTVATGYFSGDTWNGWLLPLVTEQTARAMVTELPSLTDWAVSWDEGRAEMVITVDGEEQRVSGKVVATEDGERFLYDIGLGLCWIEDEPQVQPECETNSNPIGAK